LSLLRPGVMGPCVRRDDPLRDCANGRRFRPLAGHGDILLNLARLIVIGFALNPCNIPSSLEPTRPT
jgi:hypothetical protein